MNLQTILDTAAKAYDIDGFPPDGDTLAEFIQREITDTYDPEASSKDQINEAARAMRVAEKQLHQIVLDLARLQLR